jgi:hypothetical protein
MKSRFLQSLSYILLFVLKVVAAGAFLCFFGGISLRASIAIVILLALVGSWSRQKTSSNFTLYEVEIIPNIGLMLMMLGLVTEEEWKPLAEKRLAPTPWTSLHLQYGVTAIVLTTSSRDGSGEKLVRWIAHNTDTGRDFRIPHDTLRTPRDTNSFEYSQSLEFLVFPDSTYPHNDSFDWSPSFVIRDGMDGCEIGIEVENGWWSDNKERLEKEGIAKDLRVHDRGRDTRTLIALAALPPYTFLLLDERDWDKQFARKLRTEIKEGLALAGWHFETIGFTEQIEHDLASLHNFGERYICAYADVRVRPLNP